LAFRSAVHELWGEFGWDEVISQLSDDARAALITRPVEPIAWVAERHMMALSEAVFAGPSAGSEDLYRRFVGRMMNHGFGRIRRFVLRWAPPEALLSRAGEFWHHDHTRGELTVAVERGSAVATLRDHVHTTTRLSRLTAAESFRTALGYTRARDVVATHDPTPDHVLEVHLRWR
jgi:hypothetical protein